MALIAVLGLHLLLLVGLRSGPWTTRPAALTESTAVQWILLPDRALTPAAAPASPQTPPKPRPVQDGVARRPTPPPPIRLLQAPSAAVDALQAPAAAAIEPASPSADATSAEPPTGREPPLDLRLPRSALTAPAGTNPALQGPLGDRRVLPTLEKRLELALGGHGPWTEEIIDADRRRLRRGNTCVLVQRSRLAQTDPFSAAGRSAPWQLGQPTRCD